MAHWLFASLEAYVNSSKRSRFELCWVNAQIAPHGSCRAPAFAGEIFREFIFS
jgi:hypothetical protein